MQAQQLDKLLDVISRRSVSPQTRWVDAQELREELEEGMRTGDVTVAHLDYMLWNLEQGAIMDYKRVHQGRLPVKQ